MARHTTEYGDGVWSRGRLFLLLVVVFSTVMALFFGLQSMHAYAIFGWFAQLWRDEGYSPTSAGILVGLVAATSVPLSLWLPAAAARRHDQSGILLAVMACYPVAYIGLMLAPHDLAVLWAMVVGAGTCTFPLILTLIGLRSRTPAGTAALSGFTQSAGWMIFRSAPFGTAIIEISTSAPSSSSVITVVRVGGSFGQNVL